jgi:D-xylose 1-dehydrogenase (NADP+, D-xylono-1,5-lactone-forming)
MGVVRLGFLSTAAIGDRVLSGARKSDRVEIVAVASRDLARAQAHARERGIERAYGSYEELLADPGLEAVYVPLPNVFHVEWSIRALEAGKHVLCEKPLSRDPAEVERAFDAAERAGRVLMEGFMYRHHPQMRRLEELVKGGAIGDLRAVRSAFTFVLDRPGDVRWTPELGGGSLLDVGCYCVSGSRLLAGEPEVVYAEERLGETGIDVHFAATMRFAGGVLGHFDCGFDAPLQGLLEAVGSAGSILVPDPWIIDTWGLELRRDGRLERIDFEKRNKYQAELENLAAAIHAEAEPLLGRAESVGQARALDALLRSARHREPVALS